MILVCDHTESERAARIRDELYSRGYPCALSALAGYRNCLPARLIVTFTDALDALRQKPLDHIHAIALGDGFVNSALNAQALRDPKHLPDTVRRELLTRAGITRKTAFGVFVTPDAFLAEEFMEIRGCRIRPARTEYMIFKYLMSDFGSGRYIPPETILKFCFPSNKFRDESSSIAVQISTLNRKARESCGTPIIESMRSSGYRAII